MGPSQSAQVEVAATRAGTRERQPPSVRAASRFSEAVRILKAVGPMPAPILLHGEDAAAWPVLEYARPINLDTRVGFEDTLDRPDRIRRAMSNEELVRCALTR